MSYTPELPELTPRELAVARHAEMSPATRAWITVAIFAVAGVIIAVLAIVTAPAAKTYQPTPFSCSQVGYGGGNIAPLCDQSYYTPTLPPDPG